MFRLFAVLGILLSSIRAMAQNGEILPVQFDHFFQNYSLIHPAATGLDPSLQVYLGHRALTGVFQGVNTSYAGINYRLGKVDSLMGNAHGFGINIINDREGEYINRGRMYFSYAWHSRISYDWTISAGAMLGIINYVYRGSNVNAGGSALRPTADIGLFFYNTAKTTHIGLSINQVIAGTMTPLESRLNIKRHLTFSVDHAFVVSPYFSLVPAVLFRAPVQNNSFNLDVYVMGKVQDILMAGMQYKHQKGYAFLGGVTNVAIGKRSFSFFISYYSPFTSGNDLKATRMEGTCKFGL